MIQFPNVVRALVLALAIGSLQGVVRAADEPEASEDLRAILTAAQRYELTLGPGKKPLQFEREPVLRWPNATRDTPAGGTFVWTLEGRPEVIACLWKSQNLSFAFHSLSTSQLVAEDGGRRFWHPDRPGITLAAVPDAPVPADSPSRRLGQMKDIARRFRCRLSDEGQGKEELRLLPRPLFRYKTDRPDLVDGGLFAFVQGTDPEVILMLEAQARDGRPTLWQYVLTRRSMHSLEADLDDKSIWTEPRSSGASNLPWFQADVGR